jgi:hypothetical protein
MWPIKQMRQQSLPSECSVFSNGSTEFLFGYVPRPEASHLIDVCFPFAFCALSLFLFPLIAVAWLSTGI